MYKILHPNLRKYCKDEHNLYNGGHSLMLGTLNSFRESEKEKLQDVGEGKFDLEIKLSEPQKLSEEMAQYLYSANTSRWFELGGEFSSENGAWVHRIRSAQSIPNCWVFCTSLASEDEDYGNITEEYSDFWTIDSKYIQSFATTLGQLLISQLSTVDLPEKFACDPLQDLFDRIKLEVQTGAVKYADSVITKDDLPNGEIPKTVESFLQFVAQRAIFTKPENFKKEREFRFAIKLSVDGISVPVPKEGKLLELSSIYSSLLHPNFKNSVDG